MNLFFGLIIAVLSYFIARLVFNEIISGLIAIIIGVAAASSYNSIIVRR